MQQFHICILSVIGDLYVIVVTFQKSFQRHTAWDWTRYNTLVMRIRGDGRTYMINLGTDGFFDVTYLDQYQYTLYTRGGPHWQTVKVSIN